MSLVHPSSHTCILSHTAIESRALQKDAGRVRHALFDRRTQSHGFPARIHRTVGRYLLRGGDAGGRAIAKRERSERRECNEGWIRNAHANAVSEQFVSNLVI